MKRSNRSTLWHATSAARSIKYSRVSAVLCLWLMIAVGLAPGALAYGPDELVGQPGMLLATAH